MTIEEIFKQTKANDVIEELKMHRLMPLPDIERANKALDIDLHDVNDPLKRPDKRVKVDVTENGGDTQKVIDAGFSTGFRIEKVARIKIALQKLIINRAVSFLFGTPVAYNANTKNEKQETILKALNRILYDVKSNSLDRRVARSIFAFKECAEYWYPSQRINSNYGFPSLFRLRCALFSPRNGDSLYPFFDSTGDMVAFSRAFAVDDKEKKRMDCFETWTNEEHWLWVRPKNDYEVAEGYPKKNPIGKIPIVYGYQEKFETEDVDSLIDRLEKLLSNFADTNDYHASPKIFTTGVINGWAQKGESGAVIEGEDGATMQYVSWAQAPDSVRLEIDTLLKLIYTITQTPDISFDSVKGLGTVSGVALKLLFMDAHLKVQDKREIFDEYLQRRVNVIKAYIGKFDTSLEEECERLEIEPEITPYMPSGEIDEINQWLAANGNKPLVSQKASVKGAGLTRDPEKDFEQIQEEMRSENLFAIGEPIEED